MYEPTTGRFDRLDQFAGDFKNPPSLHKYAYTQNDPVNKVDPTGLFGKDIHVNITKKALQGKLPDGAILRIALANALQDHPEVIPYDPVDHGDNDLVEPTIRRARLRIEAAQLTLNSGASTPVQYQQVLKLLGQAMHALQDLLSHTTYVFLNAFSTSLLVGEPIVPPPNLLVRGGRGLHSGYYPGDAFGEMTGKELATARMILGSVFGLITPFVPVPTHADINLDYENAPKWSPMGGVKLTAGGPSLHALAVTAATAETEEAYNYFLNGLDNAGRQAWENLKASF